MMKNFNNIDLLMWFMLIVPLAVLGMTEWGDKESIPSIMMHYVATIWSAIGIVATTIFSFDLTLAVLGVLADKKTSRVVGLKPILIAVIGFVTYNLFMQYQA